MSSSPVVQLDAASVDALGMSVATRAPSLTDPRAGSAYDPATFAAAAPVWFHPLSGQVLMLATQRWYAGVPVGGTPGSYSSVTVDSTPSWMLVTALTGHRIPVPGQPVNLPMRAPGSAVRLVGAASRPPGLLFVLSAASVGGVSTAVLQRYQLGADNAVTLAMEEVLPTPNGVIFSAGLQYDGTSLIVYGTDADHQVYKAAKPWGHVGVNATIAPVIRRYTPTDLAGTPQGWQYFTGTGYSADPSELAPVTVTSDATPLTTYGPMSFGSFRNQTFMTTVAVSGTAYTGQFWGSRSGLPFTPVGSAVTLGDSSDSSYLGGGVYLQPQLLANPAAPAVTAPGVLAGLPYVSTSRQASGGGNLLNVAWGILAVTA